VADLSMEMHIHDPTVDRVDGATSTARTKEGVSKWCIFFQYDREFLGTEVFVNRVARIGTALRQQKETFPIMNSFAFGLQLKMSIVK